MYVNKDETLVTKLREHNVNLTQNRIAILKLLTESKTALSVSVIMKQSETLLDRISVYRTLRYFLQKGIVLIVPNNDRDAKYILNRENANETPVHKHSYFLCSSCKITEIIMVPFNLAENNLAAYQVNKWSLILEGLCTKCR